MEVHTKATIHVEWQPDKNSSLPLYRQIADYISEKILSGDWLIGGKLPSQRALAQLFRVNRSTIVEAMEELKAQGVIEGQFGGGTHIVNNTWSLLMSASTPNWRTYIESGAFRSNVPTIQSINRLEFEPDIIRLSTGELSPSLFPRDMFEEVLRRLPSRVHDLNYLEPLGLMELRQVLSKRLAAQGIQASPASILITSGSLQALQLISVCMLKAGSTIYTESPSYLKSLQVFQSAGMKLQGVPMDNSGMMHWRVAGMDASLLYTIPTFHNPTGIVMSQPRREDLLKHCSNNRIPIIEDDVYRDLWLDAPAPPALKAMDQNGMVLYMGSVSKSLAPGFRLGWMVGPESVVERLGDVKMQTDYGSSSLSQWMLTEWMDSGLYDAFSVRVREALKIRRDLALSVLDAHYSELATWQIPTGGFYIWLKLNHNVSLDTDQLFNLALEHKLLINPGNVYDFGKNTCIRLSYAYAEPKDLAWGLEKLADLIRKLGCRTIKK